MSPWFLLASMSLTTFILTKLVVDLDFPPVLWLRDRVIGGWREPTRAEALTSRAVRGEDGETYVYGKRSERVPLFFADLLSCPWCVSGWLSLGTVAGTWAVVNLPVPVLMWPAVWAVGALLAQHEWD